MVNGEDLMGSQPSYDPKSPRYRLMLWLHCSDDACQSPNDQKLSDRSLEARVCAERREAKARHVLGFVAGAHAVTEPVEVRPALR